MATMKDNAHKATQIILNAIPKIAKKDWTSILNNHSVSEHKLLVFPNV